MEPLSFISSLGIAGAQSGLQALTGGMAARTQYKRQKRLMNLQHHNQMALNKHGQEMAMKTWEETNYPAQIKMLEEAGLNPALLYANGGAGGTTATGSGGSAASGTASRPEYGMMDIANQMANIDLMKSQAEKNRADADSTRGTEGTTGAADILLKESQAKTQEGVQAIQKLDQRFKDLEIQLAEGSLQDRLDYYTWEVEIMMKQYDILSHQEEVDKASIDADIKYRTERLNNTIADTWLKKAQTDKDRQQIKNLKSDLQLGWENLLARRDEILLGKERNAQTWSELKQLGLKYIADTEEKFGRLDLDSRRLQFDITKEGREWAKIVTERLPSQTETTSQEWQGGAKKQTTTNRY